MALPEALPEWDYSTTLSLSRDIDLDVARITEEVGLPDSAEVGMVAVWRVTPSMLTGRGEVEPVVAGTPGPVTVRLDLPGGELGGKLRLEVLLVLLADVEGPMPAPRMAGSVLWRSVDEVRLQGDAPMFPLAVVDLDGSGHDPRSPWVLQLPDEVDVPAMGSLLLLINGKNRAVVEAVQSAARPTPEQKVIMSVLKADVGRTLVDWALSRNIDLSDEHDEESIGAVLVALIERAFPGKTVEDLRAQRDGDPAAWASSTASALGLLADIG